MRLPTLTGLLPLTRGRLAMDFIAGLLLKSPMAGLLLKRPMVDLLLKDPMVMRLKALTAMFPSAPMGRAPTALPKALQVSPARRKRSG